VKRTEMRKLEEITAAEEQRIEKAEKDLEEDAVRLDFELILFIVGIF
jgi:hypothetical protein